MRYRWAAESIGVPLCHDNCRLGGNHVVGWVSINGQVHWSERRMNRWGLYRFLKLAVVSKLGLQQMKAGPEKTWLMSTGAFDLALSLGYRLKRDILAQDRADVRSWMASGWGQNMDDETRKKVSQWARA